MKTDKKEYLKDEIITFFDKACENLKDVVTKENIKVVAYDEKNIPVSRLDPLNMWDMIGNLITDNLDSQDNTLRLIQLVMTDFAFLANDKSLCCDDVSKFLDICMSEEFFEKYSHYKSGVDRLNLHHMLYKNVSDKELDRLIWKTNRILIGHNGYFVRLIASWIENRLDGYLLSCTVFVIIPAILLILVGVINHSMSALLAGFIHGGVFAFLFLNIVPDFTDKKKMFTWRNFTLCTFSEQ